MELTFMDLMAFHLGYVVYSLILAAVFAALLFGTAYVCAVLEIAKERRTRRRKESRNA
ncbi:membrane protein [Arthrobacter phage Iter]|nr:membrane protein [Arthrobacter phage Iter]